MDDRELAQRRMQFETDGFSVEASADDPLTQFGRWYDAVADRLPQPNTMALATVDVEGRPSVRNVLLKGADERGLSFYTNTRSEKGRALAANPYAEVCFLWLEVHRQVRVAGPVEPVSDVEADEYFASRPRGAQAGAWASPQSESVLDRATLEAAVAEVEARFGDGEISRPPHWSGYRIVPERWEFWQGRPDRLHDRVRYLPDGSGGWVRDRLGP